MCTPSRASFQTGRLPVHVITQLAGPCDANGAIPRNMTGIAAQLKKGGYASHQVGKWDCGMATPHHTPQGRGYDSSLNYFGHGNWMYSELEWQGSFNHRPDIPEYGIVDLWDTAEPASHLNGTGYEELLFRQRMLDIIADHDPSTPLFLQYDSKIAHYPLQAPLKYQEKFKFIADDNRRMYASMISFLDDQLQNITDALKAKGMWENTLMILSSDNGGYVKNPLGACNKSTVSSPDPSSDLGHGTSCFNGEAGASNFPLRGGKYSLFEGGIRVNAFASGGAIPKAVRGTKLNGIIHIADWYGTLAALAGVNPEDEWAKTSGLPPIDSMNMWPMLSGENLTSPRESILVNKNLLIFKNWKYVRGNTTMIEAARGGPYYPNITTSTDSIDAHTMKCPPQGCLFDLDADLFEQKEISLNHPDVVSKMRAKMEEQSKSIFLVPHKDDPKCKEAAQQIYGNFYGPWKETE